MRIGLYGGSFDPVHNGHVGVAKAALAELSLDRLFVIPAFVSPFKTDRAPSGNWDRLELVRLAFAELPNTVVDDRELRKRGVSYAIDTVREFAAEYPGSEIFFLVGEDSVAGLPRWKDYDELVKLCTFKSFPRTRESSTEIRRRIATEEDISDLVPAKVVERIRLGFCHILWDWNGTLLADVDAEVGSLNAMLARRGLGPVTKEFFRENFAFPARDFYRLVGMDVPDAEWDALAKEYHDTYHELPYGIDPGAVAALEAARASGVSQSIISALHQDFLDEEVERFGLRPYFDYVYGTDNLDGGSKLSRARELLARLASSIDKSPPVPATTTTILIGDSIHDFEVASALGIGCVLYSGGSHSRGRLEPLAKVGDTLEECVKIALEKFRRK